GGVLSHYTRRVPDQFASVGNGLRAVPAIQEVEVTERHGGRSLQIPLLVVLSQGCAVATDRFTETLLDALKQALAVPGEHRLYRSGKLGGLFPGRAGVNGEAAAFALREGLLGPVRTETKGRTTIEWVRLTPRGVDYLHEHESPLRALEELRHALKTAEAG